MFESPLALLFSIGIFWAGPSFAQSRVIRSSEDLARLQAYQNQVQDQKAFRHFTMADRNFAKQDRHDWNASIERTAPDYRIEKEKNASPSENSRDYLDDLKERSLRAQEQQELQTQYARHQNQALHERERQSPLNPSLEYHLGDPSVRVDWKKRKFY